MVIEHEEHAQHGEVTEVMEVKEFTSTYRWKHWLRAVSILVLTFTGFYIAYPFFAPAVSSEPDNFLYALMRSWHIIFGFLMIAVVIVKTYLTLFIKEYKMERDSLADLINLKVWIQQIGYYLFITKHPHLKGAYNPLQFKAYFGMYISFFVLIVTGLVLYVHVYHEGLGGLLYPAMRWFEVAMGGLANVREIHHIAMWVVIILVVIHIYMAIFNAVFGKNGSMDAIFSGMKWNKKH
ncbi:MAG: Ni/Fe-hydrogenase, b-type cytochrome subunit [Sulfurovum sp.]|nr:Ni/Fe-hydrogenase, b-type cytochrome subunit [Sulfurovum sp.]MCB4777944.1 Ni/Fe-hydrogenase, b-type cytochrome subunit [Sulfurovum sp.]MCB4778959.1 Ni/Fe-hydrogenase, b-type cytochrome subunit [Sulfurovum sp.]MCB4784181.1 Ni/Fe-hydrogenase, b-type cytochrome subunit [Sulfurovum sp.]